MQYVKSTYFSILLRVIEVKNLRKTLPNFVPKSQQPGVLMREKLEFSHLFCPKRKYPDFKQYGTCAIQSQTFMPNFVPKSWKPRVERGAFVCWHFINFPPPKYYFHSMHYVMKWSGGNSVSKKSTQKTFPPSEEKSFAPINNYLLCSYSVAK